jgi:hypothetical protein
LVASQHSRGPHLSTRQAKAGAIQDFPGLELIEF